MKKTIVLFFVMNCCLVTAQAILDTTLIDIPYIGNNGGAHILNWSFNKDKSTIYIYAYSHINGSQIITDQSEIRETRNEHNEKSFFGKILSSAERDNMFEYTVIPLVYEKTIDAADFSPVNSKKILFHKVDSVPNDKNVYFKQRTGFIDISFPFKTGHKIKYHYRDINVPLKYAPEFEKDIINLTYIEPKGEGLLGLKNVKPTLVAKRGFFTYDENKGYISKTKTTDITTLSDDERLKGYHFIQNTDQIFNKKYFAWFVKENDFSKYKLVVSDEKGNFSINTFDFEAPRKLKVYNKSVYNKNLDLKGVVNIFGYHRKGKKNRDIYPVNKFDVIYMNTDGETLIKTKIDYGTEKKYKNVLTPILVFEKDDRQLEFINNHILSLFKSNYEKFYLNNEGGTELISSNEYFELKDNSRINYYDYLSDFDRVDKFGDFYVIRKVISEKIEVPVKNANGSSSTRKEETDARINLTILDKDFKPVDFNSFPVNANLIGKLNFQTVENNNNEIVALARKENLYYMFKVNQTSSIPKVEFFELDIPYSKTSTPKLYFGSYNQNFALVHKKSRSIYLMNQFYDLTTYKTKVIDKIGITKIGY